MRSLRWLKPWKLSQHLIRYHLNSLGPSEAIWQHRTGSILMQLLACYLKAPIHCLNECWLVIKCVLCHSPENNLLKSTHGLNLSLTHCGLVTPYGDKRSGSTLAQVTACCLTAPSHYLNQCWLIISKVLWHSSKNIIIRRFEDTSQ